MNDHSAYPKQGQCCCGEVRYELRHKPMFVHCCHCSWCQRETGSAFAVNALVESLHVVPICGEVERISTPSSSGAGQDIMRCPRCKVALWSHYGAAREAVAFVRVGTLDYPQQITPDIHIFTSSKQAWVLLSEDIPAVEEYYQRSKYWPHDSVCRYKAALGKA